MVVFIKLLSFLVLSGWFLFALKRIVKGKKDSILFVICVFYVFFGTPLLLDVVLGMPEYKNRPGFYLASRDSLTSIIYSVFVAIVPFFWWRTRAKSLEINKFKIDINAFVNKFRSIIVPSLFILMASPVILWCFSPDPLVYLQYGSSSARGFSEASAAYHTYLGAVVYASIIASALLFMIKKKELFLFFLSCLAPFLFVSMWLSGKRFVFFLIVILFTYILLNKGLLKGKKILIYSIAVVILLGVYTVVYQSTYRADAYSNPEESYENIRIDFGRDDVTKLAIYAETDPHLSVLEHRGQSLLFNSLFFIPRDWWEGKPYPYPKYVTSAMFLQEPELWSWGVTTSIIDSAIADFGWLGFLIGPLFITIICRFGDRRNSAMANFLTTLVACLFLVLHLPAFVPIFFLWLFVMLIPKKKNIVKETRKYQLKEKATI